VAIKTSVRGPLLDFKLEIGQNVRNTRPSRHRLSLQAISTTKKCQFSQAEPI
jgi:hypothetical protein